MTPAMLRRALVVCCATALGFVISMVIALESLQRPHAYRWRGPAGFDAAHGLVWEEARERGARMLGAVPSSVGQRLMYDEEERKLWGSDDQSDRFRSRAFGPAAYPPRAMPRWARSALSSVGWRAHASPTTDFVLDAGGEPFPMIVTIRKNVWERLSLVRGEPLPAGARIFTIKDPFFGRLPIVVIAEGAILNTGVYAGGLLLLYASIRRIIAWRRLRPGLCRCGYSRDGLGTGTRCPECGAVAIGAQSEGKAAASPA